MVWYLLPTLNIENLLLILGHTSKNIQGVGSHEIIYLLRWLLRILHILYASTCIPVPTTMWSNIFWEPVIQVRTGYISDPPSITRLEVSQWTWSWDSLNSLHSTWFRHVYLLFLYFEHNPISKPNPTHWPGLPQVSPVDRHCTLLLTIL